MNTHYYRMMTWGKKLSFIMISFLSLSLYFSCQSSADKESLIEDEIFRIVEVMPRFSGCEDLDLDDAAKKECADQKLLKYLYENLKYPDEARKANLEGRVYVQFVIEKNGTLYNINLVKDIGGGCGEAAMSVLQSMIDQSITWTPGMQRGEAVRVLYTLPVTYKLEG